MGWPTTTYTKILAAASSTSIGSISTAAGGTVTLSCALLDTARRISVASASLSGPSYVITGLDQNGHVITESIIPSTTVVSAATTTQDFIKVTSVSLSCSVTNSSGGFLIGTTTQGGTPWVPIDTTRNPINVVFGIDITSPSTVVVASFEYTQDYPNFNPASNLWVGTPTNTGPRPTISSFGSSVTLDTAGTITTPFVAWRMTMTSSSSGAGTAACSVMQSGV
jgi:hypothetical protein